jgi:hypothetical protein
MLRVLLLLRRGVAIQYETPARLHEIIDFTFHARVISPTRKGLEHFRSHAFGDHRLPSLTARESSNYRQSKSGIGEKSVVR